MLVTNLLLISVRAISPLDPLCYSNTQSFTSFTSWISVVWQNRCVLPRLPRHHRFSPKSKHAHPPIRASSTDSSLLTLLLLLLLLSGDIESNPGPPNDTVKCVCSSCDESGLMFQCEMCSNWSYCECVKISPAIADNLPYVCPFCIKSHLLLVSELTFEISHLRAHIIRFEKSCSCKSQHPVSPPSVSSSPPLPTSSTNPTTLPLNLPNNSNPQLLSSGILTSLHHSITSSLISSAVSASFLPYHSTHSPPNTLPSSTASTPSLSLNHPTAPLPITTAAPTIISAVPSIITPSSSASSLHKSS